MLYRGTMDTGVWSFPVHPAAVRVGHYSRRHQRDTSAGVYRVRHYHSLIDEATSTLSFDAAFSARGVRSSVQPRGVEEDAEVSLSEAQQ